MFLVVISQSQNDIKIRQFSPDGSRLLYISGYWESRYINNSSVWGKLYMLAVLTEKLLRMEMNSITWSRAANFTSFSGVSALLSRLPEIIKSRDLWNGGPASSHGNNINSVLVGFRHSHSPSARSCNVGPWEDIPHLVCRYLWYGTTLAEEKIETSQYNQTSGTLLFSIVPSSSALC